MTKPMRISKSWISLVISNGVRCFPLRESGALLTAAPLVPMLHSDLAAPLNPPASLDVSAPPVGVIHGPLRQSRATEKAAPQAPDSLFCHCNLAHQHRRRRGHCTVRFFAYEPVVYHCHLRFGRCVPASSKLVLLCAGCAGHFGMAKTVIGPSPFVQ